MTRVDERDTTTSKRSGVLTFASRFPNIVSYPFEVREELFLVNSTGPIKRKTKHIITPFPQIVESMDGANRIFIQYTFALKNALKIFEEFL